MNDWKPSPEYQKVVDANRRFYEQAAALYDTSETCVKDGRIQQHLEADLDRILAIIGPTQGGIRALDACGGSGNVALKLLRRGVDVTLVDVSPELLEIFRNRCGTLGMTPRIVCSEIGSFLAETSQRFDLIVFSSALHHLENIGHVLRLAFHCLAPRGLLYTVFDPTSSSRLHSATRLLKRLEYFAFKLFWQPGDLPASIMRRLRRVISGVSARRKSDAVLSKATAGLLAEYHAERGIDDLALVAELRTAGFEVVWHDRYADSRFDLTRRIIERIGDLTSFKLLLRRSGSSSTQA